MSDVKDRLTATCTDCQYTGSLAALELHSCDIQQQGGRCEDYPCCGHTDGDGCQTLPEHTSAYYYRNPQFLHEPGSPEWYDAQEQYEEEEEDEDDIDPDTCPHDSTTGIPEVPLRFGDDGAAIITGWECERCEKVLPLYWREETS